MGSSQQAAPTRKPLQSNTQPLPGRGPSARVRLPAESSGMSLPMLAEDFSEGVTDPSLLGELQKTILSKAG